MFLRKKLDFIHTLAFRLTLWYAGIFTVLACMAFLFFYFFIVKIYRDQTDHELSGLTNELAYSLNINGIDAVNRVVALQARESGEKKIFVRLLYPNGAAISSSNMSYWKDITISPKSINQIVSGLNQVFETITIANRKDKVRILYSVVGPGILLQIGQSMENQTRFIEAFKKIFITTMTIMIVLAALIGWFMARQTLTGVEEVTKTAGHIAEGALDQRVPVNKKGDEIDQLAVTFNRMLDRIEVLVTGIKEISDNIAHDLKSPITRIRGLAEITLTSGINISEYENMAAGTIEECDRLLNMINTMLTISKTEAGIDKINLKTIDINSIITSACELFGPIAEDKDISLNCNVSGPYLLNGDFPMIQRMISNLMDNAIKYTQPGGKVNISTSFNKNGFIDVIIKDTGIGVSEEDIPNIFKRFYRCDRSRSAAGTGLGLSLAKTIAKAHGGDITVESKSGEGSTFTVSLPAEQHNGKILSYS